MGEYTYDAFGNVFSDDVPDPFGYCGEYRDGENGLIYLRNRYYDSADGRFITEDPVKDSLNWYVYCGNEPVMMWDPSGLENETDKDKYGSDSLVYSALVTLGDAWDVFEKYRLDIEDLANQIRSLADEVGVDIIERNVTYAGSLADDLNPVEKVLSAGYPAAALLVNEARKTANKKTKQLFGEAWDKDGGEENAFKHAYWNMRGSEFIGTTLMKYFGDAHEFGQWYNFQDSESINVDMDIHNNMMGRLASIINYEKHEVMINIYLISGKLKKVVGSELVNTTGNARYN